MADPIVVLTPEDLDILKEMVRDYKGRPRREQRQAYIEQAGEWSPETYIALTPTEGIPALAGFGTGTGSGTGTGTGTGIAELANVFPGSADCQLAQVVRKHGYDQIEQLSDNSFVTVYNLGTTDVPGGVWIPVLRDKFGTWLTGREGLTQEDVDIDIQKDGVLVGTRPALNLKTGSNITLTVTDSAANNRVDATIAATGSSGLTVKHDGTTVGTRPAINLHAGANITLTPADDSGNDEVDITIAAAGAAMPSFIGLRWTASSNQTITTGTTTGVQFYVQVYETGGTWSGAFNTRATVPSGQNAYYLISAQLQWAADAAGTYRSMALRVNGSNNIAVDRQAPSSAQITNSITTLFYLNGGDYVEVMVFHDAGHNLDVLFANYHTPILWIVKVAT